MNLSELPRRDVDDVTAERIRRRAHAALAQSPSTPRWFDALEGAWTRFVELPAAAAVIALYLFWCVSGIAATHRAVAGEEEIAGRAKAPAAVLARW